MRWLLLALTASALLPRAHAHDEWNFLHLTPAARSEFVYPFDGRTPKVSASLLNHYTFTAPAVVFRLRVDGQLQPAADSPFTVFPEGALVVGPDSFGYAHALTAAIFDGRAGPAPAVGQSRDVTFDFVFQLAPGISAPPGQSTPPTPTYVQDVRVRFTHLGDSPTLAGPFGAVGSVRLAAPSAANTPTLRAEIATPYSPWFPVPLTPGDGANTATTDALARFAQSLPNRADWHLRLSADGHATRVAPLGHPNDPRPNLDLTLAAAEAPALAYRRALALPAPTGFFRAAVSESEGTFVVFPGQERWPATIAASPRDQRSAGRIAKFRFDGTRLWEHTPGWETWAGDLSADGRFVAYAPHPAAVTLGAATENKLVLLDAATGAVLWTRTAPPADPVPGRRLDTLALAFSPDARALAVGSASSGRVTLFDRASGNALWTSPPSAATAANVTAPASDAPGLGAIRSLRFSADGRFLYAANADAHVRQLRVADGAVLWSAYTGAWPDVQGLDLSADGEWLVVGSRSLDATLIRTRDGQIRWQTETQHPDAAFAPDARHVVTAGGQVHRTLDGTRVGLTATTGATRFTPDGRHLLQFGAEARLFDLGGKHLRTFEPPGFGPSLLALPPWIHVTADGRRVLLLARHPAASGQIALVLYERVDSPATAPPRVVTSPLAQALAPGTPARLVVSATGTPPLAFQWRKNGRALDGAVAASLLVPATADAAGSYDCIVSNAGGVTTSAAATLTFTAAAPADPARLANLAVRTALEGAPLIVGFALGGTGTAGTKPLLIRAAGPALRSLGVDDALTDPRLELFSGATRVLANDDWAATPAVAALAGQVGAFPFPAASLDAALVATAVQGSYTAQVAPGATLPANTAGTVLAEIYDGSAAFDATTPRLVNISARSDLSARNPVLIAGFVTRGAPAQTVLIRAIGPSLAGFGVARPQRAPQLRLFRDATLVATNDRWHDSPDALAVADAAARMGAFPLDPGSADAALLLTLPPGSYTAQVAGTEGTVLIEVYEVR